MTATTTTTVLPADPHVPLLSGRGLRFVLVNELMNRPNAVVTIADLVQAIARTGLPAKRTGFEDYL